MKPSIIESKAEAILLLARADSKRCQGSTFLLRVLSNYATNGRDAGSGAMKRENPRISLRARELKLSWSKREFEKATINEHPDPLNQVWSWIIEHRDNLSPVCLLRRIYSYAMVTITREEDRRITGAGLRDRGNPVDRFEVASIVLVDFQNLKIEDHQLPEFLKQS